MCLWVQLTQQTFRNSDRVCPSQTANKKRAWIESRLFAKQAGLIYNLAPSMLEEKLNAGVWNGIHNTDESNWAPLLP